MEINILRGDLFEGLKNIQTIVEKRTTLPILNNFLLSTKEEGIEISATDLEIEYKGFYPEANEFFLRLFGVSVCR